MTTSQFVITDGPSTDRVVDAFRYTHDPDVTIDVEFTGKLEGTSVPQSFRGYVTGLSYESGASGMFLISGFFPVTYYKNFIQTKVGDRFQGFYNANRREGNLTLTSQ